MNGIPIRNSFDGQFDPTLIPAEIITEIKITSGGGSVLYGPGGNGGAIDIITKSGEEGGTGPLVRKSVRGTAMREKPVSTAPVTRLIFMPMSTRRIVMSFYSRTILKSQKTRMAAIGKTVIENVKAFSAT